MGMGDHQKGEEDGRPIILTRMTHPSESRRFVASCCYVGRPAAAAAVAIGHEMMDGAHR